MIQEQKRARSLVNSHNLPWTRDGHIPFAIQNALIATAIARSCGLPDWLIAAGLAGHEARPESMPGSFNVFDYRSATIVVDRPVPSWFLRSSLRAAVSLGTGRQVRVVGPMSDIPEGDILEIGRLLGRNGGVLFLHGVWEAGRLARIRQGAAVNLVPPIILQAPDERSAVQQAMLMLRADDVMLVLAENAPAMIRLIQRRLRQDRQGERTSVRAVGAS
jgi:cyanophycin synthetase